MLISNHLYLVVLDQILHWQCRFQIYKFSWYDWLGIQWLSQMLWLVEQIQCNSLNLWFITYLDNFPFLPIWCTGIFLKIYHFWLFLFLFVISCLNQLFWCLNVTEIIFDWDWVEYLLLLLNNTINLFLLLLQLMQQSHSFAA